MKIRTLLFTFAAALMSMTLGAQDVIVVEGGADNGGLLETTINNDTRDIDNRIYELKRGEYYMMHGEVNVDNAGRTITIRAEAGDGPKPVIIRVPLAEVAVGDIIIKGNFTMQGIQYHVMQTDGAMGGNWENHFLITGNNHKLVVEDCLFEFMDGVLFNTDGIENGQVAIFRNNYFRDFHNSQEWWSARVINFKVPVDTFIYENNSHSFTGLTVLSQESMFEYGMINHNTFINGTKYPFLNQYWKECYYTNNLFVNTNWVGEDMENVATGGQDPDALMHGIVGVDTITTNIWLNEKWYLNKADSTGLVAEIDGVDDYIWYAADNVCVNSTTLDAYYAGTPNDGIVGAPSSYLEWSSLGTAPYKVVNTPGIFMNSRTEALIADHDNIKAENNSVYEFTAEEMGFGTDPLPQAAADILIEWNRAQWGVADATAPDWTGAYFGDYDPTTIPGVDGEESTAGIVKFSDLTEDFSYTKDIVSNIDGMPVGALHWDDMAFDSEMLAAKVKAAYNGTLGIDDAKKAASSQFALKNYPNPFASTTTISFNLSADSYVSLQVYDVSGRMVSELISEVRASGMNTVEFAPNYSASSTYFYKLTTDFGSETRKMMMLK